MKKFLLLTMALLVLYAALNSCKGQTSGQVKEIKRGLWRMLVITDTSFNPANYDTTWESTPDTVLVWKVIHDIAPVLPAVIVRDTLYQILDGSFTNVKPPPPPLVLTTIFTTQTLPTTDGNDGQPITLGIKFTSSQPGFIKGIRFYKLPKNTGTHTGELYSSTGTLLASAAFANETQSGWQTVQFATPVPVTAGTTYVAAYYSPGGGFAQTLNGLAAPVVNSPLTGLVGGVYKDGHGLPDQSYSNSNYWVDLIYSNR